MFLIKRTKLIFTLFISVICFATYSQTNNFKVTLDAGHGAHDFGAVYNGHIEKNIALAIVLKVGKILETNNNISVNYTRKTDIFIDLIERANIANRADANIFVSIHCNANKNTIADGTETYVMGMTKIASNLEAAKKENSVITLEKDYKKKYEGFDPNSPETMIGMTMMQEEFLGNSISLANKVEEEFATIGKKVRGDGGVKQAPYMVLHKAYMTRVLIETGFVSNAVEGDILDSEDGQNDIAKAIAKAIVKYKNEYFGDSNDNDIIDTKPVKDTSSPQKTKVIDTPTTKKTEPVLDKKGVIYKVQVSASVKKMALVSKNFKGLDNISMVTENKVYKYMYGETSNYNEAKIQLWKARSKGYESAFLIAFKDGKKVDIKDVIN